jgi:hypothetical protein
MYLVKVHWKDWGLGTVSLQDLYEGDLLILFSIMMDRGVIQNFWVEK